MKTQTVAKAKAVKTPKAATKPAKTVYAIAAQVVAERIASPFYKRALAYHAKAKTAFPRAACADEYAALTVEQVKTVAEQHDNGTLASGSGIGQAVFDAYMLTVK